MLIVWLPSSNKSYQAYYFLLISFILCFQTVDVMVQTACIDLKNLRVHMHRLFFQQSTIILRDHPTYYGDVHECIFKFSGSFAYLLHQEQRTHTHTPGNLDFLIFNLKGIRSGNLKQH